MPAIDVVIVTSGSAGDLFPFLSMGVALRAAGHRVNVLAPHLHASAVEQAGLTFHPTAADPAVLNDPDLWHPLRGFGIVWRATREGMAQLPPFIAGLQHARPCLLLVHPLALPEADLCRSVHPRLKVATAYLAPQNLPTVHDPLMLGPYRMPRWVPLGARRWLWRRIGARLIDPIALPEVNAARGAHGLAPVDSLLGHIKSVPDLSIVLFPEWFGATQPDWPQPLLRADFPLYDPHPGAAFSPELVHFLGAGDAPLIFTPGTGNLQAAAYFDAAVNAVETLGRRAIFLTPHAAQIPTALPANVLWQAYLPLRALLPHAAALIHHGGIGTTAEALRAGTPQLIVPFAHDQFDNGARVAGLGAGLVLPNAKLTPSRLTRALRSLFSSPAVAQACRAVSQRFPSAPDHSSLVAALEVLVAI
jgi:rhamnosyltransferase subunit B